MLNAPGKCQNCGGPLIPLFVSLVCQRECDLGGRTPLNLEQTEGDSDWAGRMMILNSSHVMRCSYCPGSRNEGLEYRVDNYTGQVQYRTREGWAWTRVPGVTPDEVDTWFPRTFPGFRWRMVD